MVINKVWLIYSNTEMPMLYPILILNFQIKNISHLLIWFFYKITSFQYNILQMSSWQNMGGTWVTPEAGKVQSSAGMKSVVTHIRCRQGTVEQWVALRPIFKFCAREKGYKGGRGGERGTHGGESRCQKTSSVKTWRKSHGMPW